MSASDNPHVRHHMERLAAEGIDVVRVTYPDLIGTERGRDVPLDHLPTAWDHGLAFCRAVYHTSPQGDVVPVSGGLDAGLPDICVRPDLSSLTPLPWEPGVATCLGDVIDPSTGLPSPESPRDMLRSVLDRWNEQGLHPVVGPELEYFLCDAAQDTPSGWRRYSEVQGVVYTAGLRADSDNHLLRTLRLLRDMNIGVSSGNHEFDGSQFEINLTHSDAMTAADRAFRFKVAVKELARKEGRLATFMAKPFNGAGGSGFHLHMSCVDDEGANAFAAPSAPDGLSAAAHQAVAGILAHAPALAALANPTVNSYKRFGPGTLAPWLIDWGLDNRSAMVRIPPERGAGSRLELRLGDASANPYLLVAGTLAAALLGVVAGEQPPAPLEGYGYDTTKSSVLPMDLPTALDALEADTALTEVLGKDFVTSYLTYKRDEVARFQRHVTDWEFTEYAYHL
ncbi:glutamine synthetase family protein [Streptomyces rugosispiralis]|uniref:Glutamine synthetase family protein n=1 Tax=Streptomyces rugosispiralis TaxID=2967341 RepID=A0ABT1UPP9_9ACTN|nr:glutamine synthetase family protein [Streptomyces rugosispiralis]MCQ8187113.1 glutamine synthetase family protein [Streptomyces rugosispiralis]